MINFSKIQEDEYIEEEELVGEPDGFYRIALPVLTVYEEDPKWRQDSMCLVYPSVNFFDARQNKVSKATCAECTVRERCLAFAFENNEEHGVWGGLSAEERKQIRGTARKHRDRSKTTVLQH